MKKVVGSLLIFSWVLQISAPSFAQTCTPESETQELSKCMGQFFKKTETIYNKNNRINVEMASAERLDFMKHFLDGSVESYNHGKNARFSGLLLISLAIFAISIWRAEPKVKKVMTYLVEIEKQKNILSENILNGARLAKFGGEETINANIKNLTKTFNTEKMLLRPWMLSMLVSLVAATNCAINIVQNKKDFLRSLPSLDELRFASSEHNFFTGLSSDDPVVSHIRYQMLQVCNESLKVDEKQFIQTYSPVIERN